ncbi:hypothetical protein [Oceanobacillus oncorhynchi]|uniref:hypothetical protein n=1 Tax=Oceanobacillus oncorhynchi TaxID=545501 RepID=UPI0025A39E60|nr:hypothetical protein [Oceanobacillus oncorhynchi]MDM8100919.1 hypothetical protein [Oceanobacillus oncorhynchi]
MEDLFLFLEWIEGKGILYYILIIMVIVFIIKPEIAKRIGLIFTYLFSVFKWAKKSNVSRSFELKINNVTKEINKEIGNDVLPNNPKIKWVKSTTKEAFLQEDQIVVKLDYHEDRNKSFALVTLNYVNRGLLPVARQYIPQEIIETCSLLVTRRIISDENRDSLEYFVSSILKEVFLEKPQLEEMYKELTDLDNNAMFLQILIPELWKMGKRIYPHNINPNVVNKEIEKLIKFLHDIATKPNDRIAKLNLDSNLFKIRIILVGKMETLHDRGIDPYLNRVNEGINNGYKAIYLLGYERKEQYLNDIEKRFQNNDRIEKTKITVGKVLNSNFDNMNCLCISLSVKEDAEESSNVS